MSYIKVNEDNTVEVRPIMTPEMSAGIFNPATSAMEIENWVEYTGTTYKFSYMQDGVIINQVPSASFESIRTQISKAIRFIGSKKLQNLIEPYSSEERETWVYQQAEAEAYSVDSTVSTPYCDSLAIARGIDRVTLLLKIKANIDSFKLTSAYILGEQQKHLDIIYSDKYAYNKDVDGLFYYKWK